MKEVVNRVIKRVLEENDSAYRKWKKNNVTLRGIKSGIPGDRNNVSGYLGNGLYTVPLSNKSMAREYGTVFFVVNAIPKNPKMFNTTNEWEIWFYNLLYQFPFGAA